MDRMRTWSLGTLVAALALVALLAALLALVDADHLRGPLVGFMSRHTGRPIRIDGALHAHLLSLHPRFVAEQVTIGNPPWSPPGTLAAIGKLTVELDLPIFGRPYVLRKLAMESAEIHLQR